MPKLSLTPEMRLIGAILLNLLRKAVETHATLHKLIKEEEAEGVVEVVEVVVVAVDDLVIETEVSKEVAMMKGLLLMQMETGWKHIHRMHSHQMNGTVSLETSNNSCAKKGKTIAIGVAITMCLRLTFKPQVMMVLP